MVTKLISFVVCTCLIFSVVVSKEASKKGAPKHAHVGAKVVPVAPLTGDEPGTPSTGISYPSTYSTGPGGSIGFTFYDFGTNGSPNRNLINFDDVTISFARMASQLPGPGWLDRGSWTACTTDGGATWPPLTNAEGIRTGWTNIAQIADANGTGAIVSHDAATMQFQDYVDADRCANVWSGGSSGIAGLWPRIAVGNGFGMHVLHGNGPNPPTAVVYSHSPDAGATWDVMGVQMFNSFGDTTTVDGWNITAQGDNVALVSAGRGGDVVIVTSTDGGSTWNEQRIYDVDNTWLTPQDVPDASCSAVYDLSGNLHVVWGNFYALGDGALYYSIDAGIYHWSEATGAQEIALPTQDTSIAVPLGTLPVPLPGVATNGDLASCPDIGVDDNNNLYVIYQNYIAEKDVNLFNYQHPYGLGSSDGGATWTTPIDLTPGFGFDASFATMADHVGQYLHISYLSDPFAGNAQRGCHTEVAVAMMYLQVDKTLILPTPMTDEFFDDFDAYTAGTQLVSQNNTDWDTWSSLPGSGEDPFVSNAHSFSGSNTVVIALNNDLVRLHGQRTTGSWGISFQVYIPTGKAGYFNTLSGFRPDPNYWGMECYFDAGGGGRLLTGDPQVNFTWTPDTWHQVEVIVDLDQDQAQLVFNGSIVHQWQWTMGATGGTGPLMLDANDFFGATANDEMYVDDYHFVADSLRTTGVHEPGAVTPREFALDQNYPNPFNPSTSISYQLPASSHVVLKVFDLLGQEVKTLVEQDQTAGYYTARWDGKNNVGASVGSGVYFFRINAKGDSEKEYASFKRMLLLK